MAISASDVAALRAITGAGILDAKQALEEANGMQEAAIDILRKKGRAQAVKKADRMQGEGGIFIAANDTTAALVGIRCETDFVSRSDVFRALGQSLADTLLSKGQESFSAYVAEKIPAAVLELGENISLAESKLVSASVVGTYVHSNRKIGVIVGISKGTREQATDAAMHAAAMNPLYRTPTEVADELVARERSIWNEQMAKDAGKKPPEIIEKIMTGKEKKFREENALTTQPFVKDQNVTVGAMLGGADVVEYMRLAF